ncbi:MAG: SLC13 family permease, partial [Candidatus Binataceae bacterium]
QPRSIYEQIDWTLLVMFAGLFIVVRGAETTHLLEDLVRAAGPERLKNVAVLSVAAAVLSNLVSNVPAVLLFKPIYPQISQGMSTGLVLASASTLAGNLTLLGSIANLIVIEQARREGIEISFIDYLKVGLPVTLVTLAIDIAWLQFLR